MCAGKYRPMDESFFERVFAVARQIPYGRVTSYGAIAAAIGSARSARMVGWAMNSSHTSEPPVPAHRVVNRKGVLTGKRHFSGSQVMADLLKSEGVEVEADKILNFDTVFWNPNRDKLNN